MPVTAGLLESVACTVKLKEPPAVAVPLIVPVVDSFSPAGKAPQHLVDAVLWPEVRKEEVVLIEENNDENARYYVLTVLRGGYKSEILRKVWFDRADLRVARLQAYGPKGALLSDVRYANWQPVAAGSTEEYPMSIRLERPRDEYRLDLAISKITLNETLEADRFKLEAPAGADVVRVGENSGEKRP